MFYLMMITLLLILDFAYQSRNWYVLFPTIIFFSNIPKNYFCSLIKCTVIASFISF